MARVPVILAWWLGCRCAPDGPPTGHDTSGSDTAPATATGDTGEPVEPGRTWVKVDTAPCALDASGYVYCWRSRHWTYERHHQAPMPVNTAPMDDLVAPTTAPVVGRRAADGVPEVWHCTSLGPIEASWCHPPEEEGVLAGEACLLRPDGDVINWHEAPGDWTLATRVPGSGPFVRAHGHSERCAGVSADGRAAVAIEEYSSYEGSFDLPVSTLVALVQAVCALHPDGSVSCVPNPDPAVAVAYMPSAELTSPPYQRLAGGTFTLCGQRLLDDVIECNDGQTFDFGPIRHLAAFTFDEVGNPSADWSEHPPSASVCVITEANEIRCEGTRFPPDLRVLPPEGWVAPAPGQFPPTP